MWLVSIHAFRFRCQMFIRNYFVWVWFEWREAVDKKLFGGKISNNVDSKLLERASGSYWVSGNSILIFLEDSLGQNKEKSPKMHLRELEDEAH